MKVLWVVNTIFPELALKINTKVPNVGGWMYGLADEVKKLGVQLVVCTVGNEDHSMSINNTSYYVLGQKKNITEYDSSLEPKWAKIIELEKPDVCHFHGTEYPHGLALLKILNNASKTVISIQGLISVYQRYYLSGLSNRTILKNITLRDILKFETLFHGKGKMKKRVEYELQYLKKGVNFIGRTDWDLANVKALNHKSNYFFCNENLRDVFYKNNWNLENIIRHKIFLSQAAYPIKGLHILLRAIAIVKKEIPQVKVTIGGADILKGEDKLARFKRDGYGSIISSLIKKYDLKENIKFMGNLNKNQMVQEFLTSHVFVCPSSIENSPNSLGEAQILGVPTIASFVGGVSTMTAHKEESLLYPFEDYEILALYLKDLFLNDELAIKLSQNGQRRAKQRHDRTINAKEILNIYKKIDFS